MPGPEHPGRGARCDGWALTELVSEPKTVTPRPPERGCAGNAVLGVKELKKETPDMRLRLFQMETLLLLALIK